jgi:heme-degrading monooxygenase HmoA
MPKTLLFVVRYKWYTVPFAFIAMAIFHLPLFFNKQLIPFYKLMGCGRNGTFDKTPDVKQWCVLITTNNTAFETLSLDDCVKKYLGTFIYFYLKIFSHEQWVLCLQTIATHGTWDGATPFGATDKQSTHDGIIAVLTRATIRLNRFSNFWSHVQGVANTLQSSNGFITSIGVGEVPWVKQATISIWKNEADMKAFAYKRKEHAEVVQKTRKENWYSEDLFARFKVLDSKGSLNGESFELLKAK